MNDGIKIEDGFYQGKLIEATMCERGDNPLLVLTWELMDDKLQGHHVQSEMYFTGGARTITLEAMRACGWDESADLISMLGSVKSLLAKTSPKYGQQWSPWTKTNKPMDRSKAKSFLASISGKAAANPFANVPPPNDDDIPF